MVWKRLYYHYYRVLMEFALCCALHFVYFCWYFSFSLHKNPTLECGTLKGMKFTIKTLLFMHVIFDAVAFTKSSRYTKKYLQTKLNYVQS